MVTLFGWCFEFRKSAATSNLRSVRCIQSGSLMATLIQPRVVRDRLFSPHGVRMHSFCIVRPPHSGTQEEALHWLAEAHIRRKSSPRRWDHFDPHQSQFSRNRSHDHGIEVIVSGGQIASPNVTRLDDKQFGSWTFGSGIGPTRSGQISAQPPRDAAVRLRQIA